MAQLRSNGPYVWVTWLTKLLAGEHSCEWAAWFKSHHESWSWEKAPITFDVAKWQVAHTEGVIDTRAAWEREGYTVFTESQNSFALRGKTATLGGKPDLIARKGSQGVILDVKTGKPSPSHGVQVMLYMYAVPRALGHHLCRPESLGTSSGHRLQWPSGLPRPRGRHTRRGGRRSVHPQRRAVHATAGAFNTGKARAQPHRVCLLRHHGCQLPGPAVGHVGDRRCHI